MSVKVLSGPTIVATPATAQVKQGGTTTFAVTLAGAPTAPVTVGVARTAGQHGPHREPREPHLHDGELEHRRRTSR